MQPLIARRRWQSDPVSRCCLRSSPRSTWATPAGPGRKPPGWSYAASEPRRAVDIGTATRSRSFDRLDDSSTFERGMIDAVSACSRPSIERGGLYYGLVPQCSWPMARLPNSSRSTMDSEATWSPEVDFLTKGNDLRVDPPKLENRSDRTSVKPPGPRTRPEPRRAAPGPARPAQPLPEWAPPRVFDHRQVRVVLLGQRLAGLIEPWPGILRYEDCHHGLRGSLAPSVGSKLARRGPISRAASPA